MSALVGGSIKTTNNKFSVNLSVIQNGQSTAGDFVQESIISNSAVLVRDNLEYSERTILNALIKGEHSINEGNLKVEWRISPTASRIYDKDERVTPFRYDNGAYRIEPSEGAQPQRLFRNLEEQNLSSKIEGKLFRQVVFTKRLKIRLS